MMTFRGGRLGGYALPPGTVWLLTEIAEARGRQELYTRQTPKLLEALRQTALIQSAESSNRIEGVTVDAKRLKPLVLSDVRPRDRSEEEVQNYRKALDLIHKSARDLDLSRETCLRLHGIIQEGAGDAGQFKRVDNEIVEMRPGQPPVVRFRALAAAATPAGIDELGRSYRHAIDQERVQPLVAVAGAVLDFLCIHPFRDGNGRVSRLLTLLLLYHHGYEVGRYISLERLAEDSKEDYYEALRRSSQGWHDGSHDLLPWLDHFLSIVRRAYRDFAQRADRLMAGRGAKTTLLRAAIASFTGEFSAADLHHAVPGVSLDMVRRVLAQEQRARRVRCVVRGRDARWTRVAPRRTT